MAKRSESPDFYEVLRGTLRDGRPTADARGTAVATPPVEPPPPIVTMGSGTAVAEPAPVAGSPAATSAAPMGERTLTIKYDTLAFLLFFLLGALFVAFALGALWGQKRRADEQFSDPNTPSLTVPMAAAPVTPVDDGTATLVSGPKSTTPTGVTPMTAPVMPPATTTTVVVAPAADLVGPPAPANGPPMEGSFTVCLMQYKANQRAIAESSAGVWRQKYGVGAEIFVQESRFQGGPSNAVYYGRFPTAELAEAEAKRWQRRSDSFKPAYVVDLKDVK